MNLNLFITSIWIASKHSSRRLLCLLCVLMSCGLLLFGALTAMPAKETPKAVIAVRNLDENPATRMAFRTVTSMESMSELFEIKFIKPETIDTSSYTAVVTIPENFMESVLNGENKHPLVEVDISSPLEAMWVRQIAQAGASYLTSAQLGIYTVQEGTDYGRSMDAKAYEKLIGDVNLIFMRAFLNRLDMMEHTYLSASGALSLPQYYGSALAVVLLFSYGFLFMPAVRELRHFSKSLPCGRGRWELFSAAALHIWVLTLAAVVPLCLLVSKEGFRLEGLLNAIVLSVLVSAFAVLLTLAAKNDTACAAGCIFLAVAMGLCSGCFLPLALMPEVFARIAPFTAAGQGMRLAEAVLTGKTAFDILMPALLMSAVFLVISALLWRSTKRR